MVGAAFSFLSSLFIYALIALDRQQRVLLLTLVALVVNLGLNLALIPGYGYTAAAAIATGTQVVIVTGAVYLVWRYTQFVPGARVLLRAVGAGAAVLLVLTFVPMPFVVSLAVGGLLYAVLLLALRVDRELELAQLLRRS